MSLTCTPYHYVAPLPSFGKNREGFSKARLQFPFFGELVLPSPEARREVSGGSCFVTLIICCFFLCSCENNENEVKNLTTKALGVEEAKNVIINYTLGGKTKSVLKAPLMLRVQDAEPYSEFPKTLQADFYNDAGVLESKLTAQYAKYKENQSIVFLKDSIKVINIQKGDTLYCTELYWDRNKTGSEFYTDKPVRIRTKTQILNGVGMESGQDFKNWHILKSTGTIQVPASKFPG